MNIIIKESQLHLFESLINLTPMEKERLKNIEDEKATLENYIESRGEYMTDITNGKTYLVQYLRTLSELVGKGYAMCAPVRSDGTYGAFYVKPYDSFRKNASLNTNSVNNNNTKRKPNLYQRLGLNV